MIYPDNRRILFFARRFVTSVLACAIAMLTLASCGGLNAGSSPEEPYEAPTQERAVEVNEVSEETFVSSSESGFGSTGGEVTQASVEGSGDAGGLVGDLIMVDDDDSDVTLTFVDTQTGDSDSRYFSLPDDGEVNPNGWRLPFDEDFTRLAVVSEWRDGGYYRSAGYVTADGGYVEEISAGSSFEGEGGFYAATFYEEELWTMDRDYQWVDAESGEVRGESPKVGGNESEFTYMYIGGSSIPMEYGLGECWDWNTHHSRTTSRCYEDSYHDIEFFSNETMIVDGASETIEVNESCYSLLALDSEDNFYCINAHSEEWQIVRIENSSREVREITPVTDQEILQAIVSENGEQVLFTARRDDDPITAYIVPSEGGAEPRELPALTGYLSNEDQWFYRWTPYQ